MITTENGSGMVMPVSPMMGYGGMGNGFGNFNGDCGWWFLILFLAIFNRGGWGDNNNGGGMTYMLGSTNGDIQRGFDQQATMTGINALSGAVAGIETQLCNSAANITAAVNNGFNALEIANNARQMADMQQSFNSQTAITTALNALQAQQADCCCENRLATANLNATILAEGCSEREAFNNGIQQLLMTNTANTQRMVDTTVSAVQGLFDKICQLENNAKDNTIAELRSQLTYANTVRDLGALGTRIITELGGNCYGGYNGCNNFSNYGGGCC